MSSTNKEDEAVSNFRKYLQIPTVQPNVDYSECVKFLQLQAESIGLPFKIYYMEPQNRTMAPTKPVVIITFQGEKPELQSVLLTSHMDVVPVDLEKWTHDPFSAYKDEQGNIYARGAQDMKCVGIQYLEAIRRLKNNNLTLDRTIHVSFTPDEEIGGILGMGKFVETNEFRSMNVGFTLDEGSPCGKDCDVIPLYYGERTIWQFFIRSTGNSGHASLLHDNTAAEKLIFVVNKILNWRTEEKLKLSQGMDIGDVTSVNMTMLNGGRQDQLNVVPSQFSAGFDVRLAIGTDRRDMEDIITGWCHEAGEGVQLELFKTYEPTIPTKLDDSNPWWLKFKSECDKMKLKLKPSICAGASDSRYIRLIGIPAIGFSPMMYTPVLLHDHNEYLNENTFLNGINIYYNIIKGLATA